MLAQYLSAALAAIALTAGMSATALADSKKVAIAMFGPHPSLQQVSDGFKAVLEQSDLDIVYDEGNVNFDRSLVPQFL
ncbi:MAG: hypothetical protein AB7E55_02155, partial [Pigmentiphaga sp.]